MPLHTASALLRRVSDGMSDSEKTTTTEALKKKKRSKLLLLAPLVLVLAGVPAGAYFWMHRSAGAGAEGGAAEHKPEDLGVMPLDPFTVNLADKETPRFLRVTVQLVLTEKSAIEELRKDTLKQAQLRSSLLELLTQQMADHLNSPEGKSELKKAIAARATEALKPLKVTDVLFSDFVVQF
jgi:flagellar FliL protein